MTDELHELRCRSCGMIIGFTHHSGRLVTWCSEDCARVPLWTNEERDELIAELFLQGQTISQLAEQFDMSYQNIQHVLKRWNIRTTGALS